MDLITIRCARNFSDGGKLLLLADWLDEQDASTTEVQDDLRRIAARLDALWLADNKTSPLVRVDIGLRETQRRYLEAQRLAERHYEVENGGL